MEKEILSGKQKRMRLLRKIAFTAVFAAVAVVLKSFTNLALNIPGVGVKVGFSGIFTFFPAILCGPLWGGIASGLSDVLGYLVAPDGAYIPWLTLTAFCGGVIKGLLWMLLTKKTENKVRIILASVFALVGIFGAALNISLASDHVMNGMIANQTDLPLKGEIQQMQLSPLSNFAVSLAQYNNDTFTLKDVPEGTVYLPISYEQAGIQYNITKLDKSALKNVSGTVYIPKTYKTLPDDTDVSKITVISSEAGSAAQMFAEKKEITFEALDAPEPVRISDKDEKGFSVSSSDSYRKNLSNYLNTVVFGAELAAVVGLVFVLINFILSKKTKDKADSESRVLGFIRIAVAVVVTGVIVTTVNTFILQQVLDAWKGRSVFILLVPRVFEEIVSCTFQAYVISLLYGALYRGNLKKFIDKLK